MFLFQLVLVHFHLSLLPLCTQDLVALKLLPFPKFALLGLLALRPLPLTLKSSITAAELLSCALPVPSKPMSHFCNLLLPAKKTFLFCLLWVHGRGHSWSHPFPGPKHFSPSSSCSFLLQEGGSLAFCLWPLFLVIPDAGNLLLCQHVPVSASFIGARLPSAPRKPVGCR